MVVLGIASVALLSRNDRGRGKAINNVIANDRRECREKVASPHFPWYCGADVYLCEYARRQESAPYKELKSVN